MATHLGNYRLLANLGQGGMADVFLSIVDGPPGSGCSKLSVVKRLREHLAEDADSVAMLLDEARITARLNHPNVVQLLDVGAAGEQYFLVMEFLDGQSLHRLDRRCTRAGVPMPHDVSLLILSDVL